MNYYPKARTSDFVEQTSGDDTLIYDLKNNKAVCLNETAAAIWKLCDGSRSVFEVTRELSYKMSSSVDEDLVYFALDQLSNEGLLVDGFERKNTFAGLTRREVIRKVGIGSLVALPIVSSIIAPSALNAQSSTCHSSGVCVQANQELCPPGCTATLPIDIHSTFDGTCGPVSTFGASVNCSFGSTMNGNDISFD